MPVRGAHAHARPDNNKWRLLGALSSKCVIRHHHQSKTYQTMPADCKEKSDYDREGNLRRIQSAPCMIVTWNSQNPILTQPMLKIKVLQESRKVCYMLHIRRWVLHCIMDRNSWESCLVGTTTVQWISRVCWLVNVMNHGRDKLGNSGIVMVPQYHWKIW